MTHIDRSVRVLCVTVLLALVSSAAWTQASPAVIGGYTAQRKPRVTVLEFENTNATAQGARYGASVQAMMVTFLKRKSQFVVVERQKLGDVLSEWKRNQEGLTNLQPDDPAARELLERIDAILIGNVTLLGTIAEARVAKNEGDEEEQKRDEEVGSRDGRAKEEKRGVIQGERIEIDAKLLSRVDGRIIAAAQRGGPITCLRSIVERLGIALEQEFLRPYYGKLKIDLADPEGVRIFLTPILLDTALDEEKPPVEHSATVIIGSERDIVEPWATDPTSYTIENLLSGWYSMRLERPGYEGLGTENARWGARDEFGRIEIYHGSGKPLEAVGAEESRFIVRVDPLTTEAIDGDSLSLKFRKKGGSLTPRIKRQFLDADYIKSPQRTILVGRAGLEINTYSRPNEYAEDRSCDLFEERPVRPADYGTTYVSAGQTFDFATFKGGDLIIEHYQGEVVPAGQYEMYLWEPYYRLHDTSIGVRDRDNGKPTHSALVRLTQPLDLTATGERLPHKTVLQGRETAHRAELPLNFGSKATRMNLPVDHYTALNDIPGFGAWKQSIDLLPKNIAPPVFDPESKEERPFKDSTGDDGEDIRPQALEIKTRLAIGGRLTTLASLPDLTTKDKSTYVDRDVALLLDALIDPQEQEDKEPQEGGETLSQASVTVATGTTLSVPGSEKAGAAVASVRVGVDRKDKSAAPASRTAGRQAVEPDAETPPAQVEAAPAAPAPAPPPKPAVEPLPRDPEELRALLARRLENLDLLVLDGRDMVRLRELPEVAALIGHFVASGGTLFAFVSERGDYRTIVGAPLIVEAGGKRTARFNLIPGDIPGIRLQRSRRKLQVQSKRLLPDIQWRPQEGSWRVVAFTKERKNPRILERGTRDQGGYVVVWCDRPESFRGQQGYGAPEIEAARAEVERYVMDRARYLMYRRYDSTGDELRRAEQKLSQ